MIEFYFFCSGCCWCFVRCETAVHQIIVLLWANFKYNNCTSRVRSSRHLARSSNKIIRQKTLSITNYSFHLSTLHKKLWLWGSKIVSCCFAFKRSFLLHQMAASTNKRSAQWQHAALIVIRPYTKCLLFEPECVSIWIMKITHTICVQSFTKAKWKKKSGY